MGLLVMHMFLLEKPEIVAELRNKIIDPFLYNKSCKQNCSCMPLRETHTNTPKNSFH